MVQIALKHTRLRLSSQVSAKSKRIYTPSISKKCNSDRLFPKTELERQSITESTKVLAFPDCSTSEYARHTFKSSIPPFLLNSFWLSLLPQQIFERMLKAYSLRSRWTSVPDLMISRRTSINPLLWKLVLKNSNLEAWRMAFMEEIRRS